MEKSEMNTPLLAEESSPQSALEGNAVAGVSDAAANSNAQRSLATPAKGLTSNQDTVTADAPDTPDDNSLGDRDHLSEERDVDANTTRSQGASQGKRCIEMPERGSPRGWFRRSGDRKERRRMYMSERRLLTPTQKWRKFRKPPWKAGLHVSLMILIAWSLSTANLETTKYLIAMNRTWRNLLFPSDYTMDDTTYTLYSVEQLLDSLDASVESYYTLPETVVADIRLVRKGSHDCFSKDGSAVNSSTIKPPHLFVTKYTAPDKDDDTASPDERITKIDLEKGVPVATALKLDQHGGPTNFFSEVGEVRFEFDLCNWFKDGSSTFTIFDKKTKWDCYFWNVNAIYDMDAGVGAVLSASAHVDRAHTCNGLVSYTFWEYIATPKGLIELLQCIISVIYSLLLAASIARSARDYRLARDLHAKLRTEATRPPPDEVPGAYQAPRRFPAVAMYEWSKLPITVKAAFFSPWAIITFVATTTLAVLCLSELIECRLHQPRYLSSKLGWGLTSMVVWATSIAYLEPYPRLYQLVLTVRTGSSFILALFCGVLPIYMCFIYWGYDWFGNEVENFKSVSATSITLFSVLNGDSILDVYLQLGYYFPVLGQIYLYLFISLLIYVVLNIVIATVEESFFNSRSYKRSLQPLIRETVGMQLARERAQRLRAAEEERRVRNGAEGEWGQPDGRERHDSRSTSTSARHRTASKVASDARSEALADVIAEAVEEAQEELMEELEAEEEEAEARAEEARGGLDVGEGGGVSDDGGMNPAISGVASSGVAKGAEGYARPTKMVVPVSGAKFWGPHYVRFEELLDDLSDIDLARRMD